MARETRGRALACSGVHRGAARDEERPGEGEGGQGGGHLITLTLILLLEPEPLLLPLPHPIPTQHTIRLAFTKEEMQDSETREMAAAVMTEMGMREAIEGEEAGGGEGGEGAIAIGGPEVQGFKRFVVAPRLLEGGRRGGGRRAVEGEGGAIREQEGGQQLGGGGGQCGVAAISASNVAGRGIGAGTAPTTNETFTHQTDSI